MKKKYVLALIAISSLGSISQAGYEIRIPMHSSIVFNNGVSGGGNNNGGGNRGSNGGGGLVFTDPDVIAAYEATCGSFPNKINPLTDPVRDNDISCGDYSNRNLSGYVLDETGMLFTNFANSILDGAVLGNSNLSNSNLSGASLVGTQFTVNGNSTALTNADVSNANLTNAYMDKSYLEKTNFTNSNLTGAILTNTAFINTNLTNANLIGADLSDSIFTNVDFTNILYDETTKWPSWMSPLPPMSRNGYQFTPQW